MTARPRLGKRQVNFRVFPRGGLPAGSGRVLGSLPGVVVEILDITIQIALFLADISNAVVVGWRVGSAAGDHWDDG